MRITIDLDSQDTLSFFAVLFKALFILHILPHEVRRTRKGYHFIYRPLALSEHKSFLLREVLMDDKNRIKLDKSSPKRIKQVLFMKKKVKYYKGKKK